MAQKIEWKRKRNRGEIQKKTVKKLKNCKYPERHDNVLKNKNKKKCWEKSNQKL